MVRPIFHPRMISSLKNFFANVCQIQEPTETQSRSGAVAREWSAVAGMEEITCKVAPALLKALSAKEFRRDEKTDQRTQVRITLSGLYLDIRPKMRAWVDYLTIYNILGVEHDSHSKTTRLNCELIEV